MILLGDAAHAVTPIGGQGCNAALEDGVVLERVLAEAGTESLVFPCRHGVERSGSSRVSNTSVACDGDLLLGQHWHPVLDVTG